MAASVNKCILVGNLGKDPEVRTTQAGQKIVSFSLATSESWNDKGSGERKERTTWHNVVVMNERLGEVAEKYLRKGSKAYVEGSIQTRKFTDRSDNERTVTVCSIAFAATWSYWTAAGPMTARPKTAAGGHRQRHVH